MNFLKEDIKRFELTDFLAKSIIALIIAQFLPSPINGILISLIILFVLTEFRLGFINFIGISISLVGAAGKITHTDILGISGNAWFLISWGLYSIGIIYHLLKNDFQFNKLYIALSIIICFLGFALKLNHVSWNGIDGSFVILLGTICICCSYFYRFLLKTNKNLIDFLKVAIVVSSVANAYVNIHHLNDYYLFAIIYLGSLITWVSLHFYERKKTSDTSNTM